MTALAEFDVNPARANQAALSPDGTEVVFTLMGRVFVGPAGGGDATLVGGEGFAAWPAWTADGQHIVFSDGPDQALYEIDLDGNSRRVTQEPGERPAGSPDGRLIAFIRDNELWIFERASDREGLVAADVFPGTFPVWSPDGSELLYVQRSGRLVMTPRAAFSVKFTGLHRMWRLTDNTREPRPDGPPDTVRGFLVLGTPHVGGWELP